MGLNPLEWFQSEKKDPPSWEDTAPSEYEPPHPHDSMPIANGTNRYAPPEKMTELESNPRPEEEIADWFAENPDESDEIEREKTMHEKMYEIATSKYNPFAIGGSENLGGGSEKIQS